MSLPWITILPLCPVLYGAQPLKKVLYADYQPVGAQAPSRRGDQQQGSCLGALPSEAWSLHPRLHYHPEEAKLCLAQGRVWLLRGGSVNAGANSTLLRAALQGRNLAADHLGETGLAHQLVDSRHIRLSSTAAHHIGRGTAAILLSKAETMISPCRQKGKILRLISPHVNATGGNQLHQDACPAPRDTDSTPVSSTSCPPARSSPAA